MLEAAACCMFISKPVSDAVVVLVETVPHKSTKLVHTFGILGKLMSACHQLAYLPYMWI